MKQDPYSIIRRPVITEKATNMKEDQNKVVFVVDREADKISIKKAIENIFDVHVTKVRTINMRGKKKRLGRFEGRRSSWKKAIVTLKKGDTIEFFEGM